MPSVASKPASSSLIILLSKVLGSIVSIGSFAVKLPQIIKIVQKHNVVGLSLAMYSIEIFSQSIATYYHYQRSFPISTYGENITLGLGNLIIVALYYKYAQNNNDNNAKLYKPNNSALQFLHCVIMDPKYLSIFTLLMPLFLLPLLKAPRVLDGFQSLSIPMNIAAKLPQIYLNYISKSNVSCGSNHSTLSFVPFLLNFCGSLSRLYTTAVELNGDFIIQLGFISSCILNAIIIAQVFYYARRNSINQLGTSCDSKLQKAG
jgi:mannose-P-dolichol utilization defect protein 1